jgi:DNA-directed RNA polymerase specialized sigma24 family protein
VLASFRRRELAASRDRRREVALEDFDLPAEFEPDVEFDRLWVKNLVGQAFERLKDDSGIAALRLQMQGKTYQEIARSLSKSEVEVTNYIHRGKKRLRQEIERLIAEYANRDETPGEVDSLLQYL